MGCYRVTAYHEGKWRQYFYRYTCVTMYQTVVDGYMNWCTVNGECDSIVSNWCNGAYSLADQIQCGATVDDAVDLASYYWFQRMPYPEWSCQLSWNATATQCYVERVENGVAVVVEGQIPQWTPKMGYWATVKDCNGNPVSTTWYNGSDGQWHPDYYNSTDDNPQQGAT